MTVMAIQQNFLEHVIDAKRRSDPIFKGDGEAGLAIYRNAYRARLISCLRTSYDKSWSWMGDARFEAAAAAHIEKHVSASWSLDDYGSEFPETLAALFPNDPEIADLAALEWAMQVAFVKPDAVTADYAALASFVNSGADIDLLRLQFLPSFAMLPVSNNVAPIWRAIEDESEMPALTHYPSARFIIIWRTNFSTHFREIDDAEALGLSMMKGGATFGEMCRSLARAYANDDIACTSGTWLGRWITDGLVQRFRTKD